MTELEATIAMLTRAGIIFRQELSTWPSKGEHGGAVSILIPAWVGERGDKDRRNFGYMDFHAEMVFDKDGALLAAGAWE